MKTGKIAGGLVAVGLGLGTTALVAADILQSRAERGIASALRADGRIDAQTVTVDPWSGRVVLGEVSAATGGVRVRVGRVAFQAGQGLRGMLLGTALAADTKAAADDVDIDAGGPKIHVPHVEATGGLLSVQDLAALVQALDQVDTLTFASLAIPELSIDLGSGGRLTLDKIDLGNVKRGRIGVLTVAGGSFEQHGAQSGSLEGSIGALVLQDLDLGLMRRMATQAREAADDPVETIIGSATVDGLQVSGRDRSRFALGRLTVRDIKGRPLLAATRNAGALLKGGNAPEQVDLALARLADLSGSLTVGSTEFRDMTAVDPDGRKATTVGLARIGLSGLANANLDGFAIEGLTVRADDGNAHLGSFSLRDIGLRETLGLVSGASWAELMDTQLDPAAGRLRDKTLVSLLAEAYRAIRIGRIEVRDAAVHVPAGPNAVSLELAYYGIADFAKARLEHSSVEGFDVSGSDGHVKMAAFSIDGLNYGPALEAMEAIDVDRRDPTSFLRAMIPSLDRIVLAGLDFDVPDKGGQGNAAGGHRDRGSVGKIALETSSYVSGIPTDIAVSVDHVAFDVPTVTRDPDMKWIVGLGYPKMDVSAHFGLHWDAAAKSIRLSNAAEGVDMGSMKLDFTIANADKDLFSPDLGVAEAAGFGVALQQIELQLDNKGLFDRAMALDAKNASQTVEQRKQFYIAQLSSGLPPDAGRIHGIQTLVAAVAKFIADPRSLHVVAKSPSGLSASDFASGKPPRALLNTLEISATAD